MEKTHPNYLKDYILNTFFRRIVHSYFFTTYSNKNIKSWKGQKIEGNVIQDVRNLFRLKNEIPNTTVKDVRNLFRVEKIDDTTIKRLRNYFRQKKKMKQLKLE